MDIALFTSGGLDYLFRWGHFLAGITWIGILYYFNFIQTEYFKEAEDSHRSGAIPVSYTHLTLPTTPYV